MSLIRNLIFLVLLFLAYYAGYREWGTDVLLGWLDNTEFSEFILESWSGLVGSEMCIRDRVRSLGLGSGPGTWRSGGAGVGPGQRRGVPMIF